MPIPVLLSGCGCLATAALGVLSPGSSSSGRAAVQGGFHPLPAEVFIDAATTGPEGFLERVLQHCRAWLSGKRKHVARRVKGMDLEEKPDPLHALRNLGKGVGQARIA
jgi:hypothetical protein